MNGLVRSIRIVVAVQTAAILLLILASGWLWYTASGDRAERVAERRAQLAERERSDSARVEECYSSIETSRQVVDLLRGLEVVLENQLNAATGRLIEAPHDQDALDTISSASPALRSTREFIARSQANRATLNECATLRCKLRQDRTGEEPSSRCRTLLRQQRNPQ